MATKASTTKTPTKKASAKKTTNGKTAVTKTDKKSKGITEADIRKKAQEIYDKRILKGIPGSAESDWLKAEQELLK